MNQTIKQSFFFWRIENYSNCWHKYGEELESPFFFSDITDTAKWRLKLCPNGSEDEDFISFFLYREDNEGPEKIALNFELAFLAVDGFILHSWIKPGYRYSTFKSGEHFGDANFLRRDEVLFQGRAEYLPLDTLTACCRMWIGKADDMHRICKCFARTRIGNETVSLLHEVKHFSTLKKTKKRTFDVRSSSKNRHVMSVCLWLVDECSGNDSIMAEIIPCDYEQTTISFCKFSLIDAKGVRTECGEMDVRFHGKRDGSICLPLSLTKATLMDKKSLFLPLDTLSLIFECSFSNELELNQIEKTEYKKVTAQSAANFGNSSNFFPENFISPPKAFNDLKEMFNSQVLSDIKLMTKTTSFDAHKAILCARSSIFRSMLENDTSGTIDFIHVDDVEDNILHKFLFFLYTDTLEYMQWETSLKLYRTACRYQVKLLKSQCSSFLMQNLQLLNLSELLLLAIDHQDFDLKAFVENFIFRNREMIFSSDEWRNFIVSRPNLAAEIMNAINEKE